MSRLICAQRARLANSEGALAWERVATCTSFDAAAALGRAGLRRDVADAWQKVAPATYRCPCNVTKSGWEKLEGLSPTQQEGWDLTIDVPRTPDPAAR